MEPVKALEAADSLDKKLNLKALGPLGTILALILTILPSSYFVTERLAKLDNQLVRLNERLDRLADDRWTYVDQRLWSMELRNLNPDLNVPTAVRESRDH